MVFPALNRPKYMLVLCGLYPMANLREPFTPIGEVAEHIALGYLCGLRRFFVRDDEGRTTATATSSNSDSKGKEPVRSPMKIAEALANKRGDKTGRAGRPDVHTAARNILFDVVDGVVLLYWAPPEPLERAQQLQQRDGTHACWSTGARWCGARRKRTHSQPRSAQPVPAPSTPTGSDDDRDHKGNSNGGSEKRGRGSKQLKSKARRLRRHTPSLRGVSSLVYTPQSFVFAQPCFKACVLALLLSNRKILKKKVQAE